MDEKHIKDELIDGFTVNADHIIDVIESIKEDLVLRIPIGEYAYQNIVNTNSLLDIIEQQQQALRLMASTIIYLGKRVKILEIKNEPFLETVARVEKELSINHRLR